MYGKLHSTGYAAVKARKYSANYRKKVIVEAKVEV